MTSENEALLARAGRTLTNAVTWTTAHGLEITSDQMAAIGNELTENMRLFPRADDEAGNHVLLFAAVLTAIDQIMGKPRAADPQLWRLTMAGIGAEVLDAVLARGGYPTPPDDVRAKMARAVLKRAVGLVSLAHRFDPETAAQKMREHAAAVVDVYLGEPPAPAYLN